MMSDIELDTLPKRMRYAADVLMEATNRYHHLPSEGQPYDAELYGWRPVNLQYVADQFEEEDDKKRKAHQLEGELASFLSDRIVDGPSCPLYTEIARELIESGWTKLEGRA